MEWQPTHLYPSSLPSASDTIILTDSTNTNTITTLNAESPPSLSDLFSATDLSVRSTLKSLQMTRGYPHRIDSMAWQPQQSPAPNLPAKDLKGSNSVITLQSREQSREPNLWHEPQIPPVSHVDLEELDYQRDAQDPLFTRRPAFLAELHVDNRGLTSLDTAFIQHRMNELQFLSARGNRLQEWPALNDLRQMRRLEILALEDNLVSSVPIYIEYLSELRCLSLSNNRITSIPSTISTLSKLQALYCDGNLLERIPDLCDSIVDLDARNNNIRMLPFNLPRLTRLQTLRVGGNQMQELPPTLGDCQSLKLLDISRNHLYILPYELNQLTGLEHLNADGNRIKILHPDVLALRHIKVCSGHSSFHST
eukprot:TRINITY_DN8699_c0_g1_i2.p1 TRINITY_DN8699_c0_g1~~TRINITY_DN8699_c0_g1_i2.p1  ORF type:complete len:366 (+),score=73.28 TRINITY_DN8699_c0_g1_i2:65-1162(+)